MGIRCLFMQNVRGAYALPDYDVATAQSSEFGTVKYRKRYGDFHLRSACRIVVPSFLLRVGTPGCLLAMYRRYMYLKLPSNLC